MASINDLANVASAAQALNTQQAAEAEAPLRPAAAPDAAPAPAPVLAPASAPPRPAGHDEAQAAVARGALVVLEGLDRSGKTTQVKLLEQRFVELGRKAKVLRFPDRSTPIGQMIDAYLKSQAALEDHVIHLLFSANRWEAVSTMTALLAAGTTVLCDRYYHSGIVYSAAKQNPALPLTWARAPEVGLPRPDLVLFLDLDEAQAQARGGWGGEAYEKAEMQRRVRALFWALSRGGEPVGAAGLGGTGEGAKEAKGRAKEEVEHGFRQEEEDLVVVNAAPSVEDVAEEVWKVVRPRVEAVERGEVGRVVRRVA